MDRHPAGPRRGSERDAGHRLFAQRKGRLRRQCSQRQVAARLPLRQGERRGRRYARARLRILEGRRSRLEERVDTLRESLARSRERMDAYTLQLQQHGLDGAEREVRWLNELIQSERNDNIREK